MTSFDPIIKCCSDLLQNFPPAKNTADYINRRLSSRAQEKFGFGYFPSNEHLSVLSSVVSDEILKECDLIYDRIYNGQKYRCSIMTDHNLIMPYRDVYGDVLGIVGRSILCDEERKLKNIAKYKNTHIAKKENLFGLYEAKRSIIEKNLVIVLEGQMDVIAANDKGLENVVALGSNSMSFEQMALVLRYTDNIIMMLDDDAAGVVGEQKVMNNYSKFANIKKSRLPGGYKDLCEYLDGNDLEGLDLIM